LTFNGHQVIVSWYDGRSHQDEKGAAVNFDPLLSLAFAIHQNPGVYALLLGSGVSRSAGIPTGWEIVLHLVRKLAQFHNESPEPDPATWYTQKYGEEPAYDLILTKLGKTASERNAILRPYFEPSEEEHQQGLKSPKDAHRAIARLVRDGYIRMILTTNFDTLIETALQAEGVTPDVISTDDALKGARPFEHSKCTLLKVHGDYRDARIKNTEAELAKYSKAMNRLLDRVLDEFGLVVCGWSAQYDVALSNALLRVPSRRYTTYWTVRDHLSEPAQRLTAHRDAVTIPIEDADKFFIALEEKVMALQALATPHPLSVEAAVASTKRYLSEPRFRIDLEELVMNEAWRVHQYVTGPEFPTDAQNVAKEWKDQLTKYESRTEILVNLLAAVAWYDQGDNSHLLTRAIETLGETGSEPAVGRRWEDLLNLRGYPALRAIYAAGIASVGAQRLEHLYAVLAAPAARIDDRRRQLLGDMAPVHILFDDSSAQRLIGSRTSCTPASDYLYGTLRDVLRRYVPSDGAYQRAFDTFEFLVGLVHVDVASDHRWGPLGAFVRRREPAEPIVELVTAVAKEGPSSALLTGGLFGGSLGRFRSALAQYQQRISQALQRYVHGGDEWPDLLDVFDKSAES
jgi:hypothetical protein